MTSRTTLSSSTTNTVRGFPVDGGEPVESGASTSAIPKTVATLMPVGLAGLVTKDLRSLKGRLWAVEVAIL